MSVPADVFSELPAQPYRAVRAEVRDGDILLCSAHDPFSRLIRWGTTVGPHTAALVEQILASRPHPEQGYRSCLGLRRLTKQYGPERVEAASARAVAVGARSYRHVEAMLKHGLDRVPLDTDAPAPSPRPLHANVRGPSYYH